MKRLPGKCGPEGKSEPTVGEETIQGESGWPWKLGVQRDIAQMSIWKPGFSLSEKKNTNLEMEKTRMNPAVLESNSIYWYGFIDFNI